MDPKTSLPSKQNEVVFYNDDKNEDLNDAVDNILKGVMDYISAPSMPKYRVADEPYIINRTRLDLQGSRSSCSRFLAFSKEYKSKFDKFMEKYSRVGIYPIKDVLPDNRPKTCPITTLNDKDVLKRYKNFKRFDTVVDYSDHLFATSPLVQQCKLSTERIRKEWRILEEELPENIFVRAYESRMDLLRAVIIGAKGTPYHDGLFFFDVYFPRTYPLQPPLMRYHSGGFGINPHLFKCGEFRLDLIKTWTHSGETIWDSYATTMLQVLVSIQNWVLNADPLFHESGFLDFGPSVAVEYVSLLYNEDVLIKSLKTMVHIMNKPPKNFEAFVVGHFRNHAVDILKACKAYMEGLQAGCVVSNKDSYCSIEFRNDVASCITQLVYHFNEIGAIEATNFNLLNDPTFDVFYEISLKDVADRV